MCVSEVQIKATVVRMMASFGPGREIGFSMRPTFPIPCITKQFMDFDTRVLQRVFVRITSRCDRPRVHFTASFGAGSLTEFTLQPFVQQQPNTR